MDPSTPPDAWGSEAASRGAFVARVARTALALIIVVGALLIVPSLASWRTLSAERERALDAAVQNQLDVARRVIEKEFFEIAGDLAVAARSAPVTSFATDPTPQGSVLAGEFLGEVVRSYGRYPHLSLLGVDGAELLTVDRVPNGARVQHPGPSHHMHDAVVDRALQQEPGTIYVSELGRLDGEDEEAAHESIATIHLAVPVVAPNGRPVAVLVLHYDTGELCDALDVVFEAREADEIWLGPGESWFELPSDGTALGEHVATVPPRPLDALAPGVARTLAGADGFPTEGDDGRIYRVRTDLLPAEAGRSGSWARGRLAVDEARSEAAQWTIVARVSNERLRSLSPWFDGATRRQAWAFAAALTVLAVLAAAGFEGVHASRRRAQRMALLDALTGAGNRRAFQTDLVREVSRVQRSGAPLALVVLDLDHFKTVNDRFGHAAGDAVLRDLVDTARATLRSGDAIYRTGGEEFALILPDADRESARRGIERLQAAIASSTVPWSGTAIDYTASFGILAADPDALRGDPEEIAERLFRQADRAAYAAKEAGRDRYETASFEPTASPEGDGDATERRG